MEKSIARQIAEFAVNLKYEDLPENVINEVKRYLYDSIGCAIGSVNTKDVNAIRDIYLEMAEQRKQQHLYLVTYFRLLMLL